ncbi:MAG: hypothetical protein K2N53_07155 [Clostridia bacterium]|nr:hypothetical protein [Clostridia bacterium]
MTKSRKVLRGLGIFLLVAVILAGITLGIIIAILNSGQNPERDEVYYENLKTIMQDDVVYLSDEFMTENNLTLELGSVAYLFYNKKKVHNPDFTQRVEGIDEYYYGLKSKDNDEMPVSVGVRGVVGEPMNVDVKYNKTTSVGLKYGFMENGEIYLKNGCLSKTIVIKAYGRNALINKNSCTLIVSVSMTAQEAQNHTDDELITKFDDVLTSALKYIQRYGE